MKSGSGSVRSSDVGLRPAGLLKAALTVVFLLFWLMLASSCHHEKKVDVLRGLDASRMPTMATRNISTLISDSGVIQYRIVAPLWRVYDQVDTPYWDFPEGLYLRKYDRYMQVIATVASDSAKYYKNERLWRLEGHVEMTKKPRDLFLSERLFWDQRRNEIYSDTFIHIENATHVLEGTGFRSNDRLTDYRVLNPEGIFPVEESDKRSVSRPDTAQKTDPRIPNSAL